MVIVGIGYEVMMCRPEICLQIYNKKGRNFRMKKTYRRYGEAFKRQVVLEYESGVSVNALKKKYAIGGSETINLWIKKYAL
jgi:transposase-like protein